MTELPVDLPVWGWVLAGLGIIAAGIGLAYIIIFFFWKIARTAFEPPRVIVQPEPVKEPEPEPEPEEEVERNDIEAVVTDNFEEEIPEPVEEPVMEEPPSPLPVAPPVTPDPDKTMVRFAMNLTSRFPHPFGNVRSIVCWNISLSNGDAVSDSEGNVMTLSISEPAGSEGQRQAALIDATNERQIPLVMGKQYMKQETGLDVDKF